jgi:hypothetical protein
VPADRQAITLSCRFPAIAHLIHPQTTDLVASSNVGRSFSALQRAQNTITKILRVGLHPSSPVSERRQRNGCLYLNQKCSKQQAIAAGWKPGKALENYIPGGQIGGDVFQNSTGTLPSAPGRVWYEADIGLTGTMSRGNQPGSRLLYSNDRRFYITADHYNTVHPFGGP